MRSERKLLNSKFETRYVLEISKQLDRFSVWKITSIWAFAEYSSFSQSGKKLVKQNLEADEGGINLCTTELK